MDFEVVVATRNRPDLLAPTLRSILSQARLPTRLTVVDSSDEHEPVRAVVEKAGRSVPIEVEAIRAAPGLTGQRNVGLARVETPVVFFPDDDVLWSEGAAEAVMKIYERDADDQIAGIAMREIHTAPPGYPEAHENRSSKSLGSQLVYRFSPLRSRLERLVQQNPMHLRGRQLLAEHPVPAWLPELHAHPIPNMIGFRMTFRTEAIRKFGFDETLHAYALYEDNDASLSALRSGILVEAERAEVFHNRAPGRRTASIAGGAMLLLNLAYVACKHSPIGSAARKAIPKYAKLRGLQYRIRASDGPGKARLEGFRRAAAQLPALLEAEGDALAQAYTAATKACTEE